MEFWAQQTLSPLDGRVGWSVVDDTYVEDERAAAWLRALLDAQGRSAGTARAYAGRLALYFTWASSAGVDPATPEVEELAAFARWLERTPSRKHRPSRQRRRAAQPTGPSSNAEACDDGEPTGLLSPCRVHRSAPWWMPAATSGTAS